MPPFLRTGALALLLACFSISTNNRGGGIVFASLTPSILTANSSTPIVDLGYAQYQGSIDPDTNVTSFLSIRYAAPPIGNLRFSAPQPPANVSGVQQATEWPSMCYQSGVGTNVTTAPVPIYGFNKRERDGNTLAKRATTTPTASEDCLFLNVWVPPGQLPSEPLTTGGLPVVVWIHGGGYVAGYAEEFDGAQLLDHSDNGVVAVVLQYRLGVFGFLSGNEVKADGALNAGLLDQNLALQWVQKNIAIFGGDPSKVTIWGESAGAGSVLQHIVAHGGNTQPPLFKAGITSSTFLPSQYSYNDRVPQLFYNETVEYVGCSSSADTLACLRAANATVLEEANEYLAGTAFWHTYVFVPVVDGTFIVERPSVTLAKGKVNGGSLLAVGNAHEGPHFVNPIETLSITDFVAQLFPDLGPIQAQQAAYLYSEFGSALEQAYEVYGDAILVCPTYFLLKAFEGRSWKGKFAIPPALHGDDVPYYFNDYDGTAPPYNNTDFINAFAESFLSFAMFGDVNTKFDPTNITPYWNEYYVDEKEMIFNQTEGNNPQPVVMPIKTNSGQLERCAFWQTVADMTAQ